MERRFIIKPIQRQIIYLLNVSKSASARDLITILTTMGYQENYIRITLSKMKRNHELTTPTRGEYQLAQVDQNYLLELEKKIATINATDFVYTLILTSFEKNEVSLRQQSVRTLKNLGFGGMGNGVYLGIGDKRSALTALNQKNNFKTLITDKISPKLTTQEVQEWWDLKVVKESISKISQQFQTLNSSSLYLSDNLSLLHTYLKLINLVSEYYANDPMLPKILIGSDWQGYTLLKQMILFGKELVESADTDGKYHQFFDFDLLKR